MILEPKPPRVLSVRRINRADPSLVRAYGGDPERHDALGLITCDQDDPTYVALDEATKHAVVDVVYAHSFYAGSRHASGPLSGEILGVLARVGAVGDQQGRIGRGDHAHRQDLGRDGLEDHGFVSTRRSRGCGAR